jgi:rod shape-determining protein MreD
MSRSTLIVFAALLVLWALVAQLNHVLAPSHIYLWTGGLFVTFGALVLPLRRGLVTVFLAGLVCDATAPIAFGTHALLFAAAHVVLFNLRDRVPREETIARVVIALLANLALFLVFSFLQIGDLPAPAAAWPRLIFDLVCSQIFIAVIAPWFFALQERALALVTAPAPLDDHRFN